MFCYFDSRDKMCKSSLGAVKEGEYMRLRLRLPSDCGVWHAFLLLTPDGAETSWREMEFEFGSDGCLYYKIDISLSCGLYWYRFCYETEGGQVFITKTDGSRGCGDFGESWQQSVYRADYKTPEWLLGGVIYQIFPDRFYNSGTKKKDIPTTRYLRDDWGGMPIWQQTDTERTLCNDFFGGDLKGIQEKLPYLAELGVTCIYLNPIFLASSNHRYNTMDYEKIDVSLGTEQDFCNLCHAAHKKGIKVILDGVFSHTGDDSKYFDRYGSFGNSGAAKSQDSPYYSWYKFKDWPKDYHSWWGVPTLPEINEDDEGFLDYICGENGILRYWLRLGADGWRLDVADELPDVFLDRLREAVKAENPNAFILGEVWEDASNKISYGARRRYFEGRQLDSVMNYPVANAIIDFMRSGNPSGICNTVLTLVENYPKEVLNLLMNHIGTHDTARALTMLGYEGEYPKTRSEQAEIRLTEVELDRAKKRLKLASVLQYTLPGVPSLYYGDEAGLQGFGDPFCRGCYPWGNEDHKLLEHYRFLGSVRKRAEVLKQGEFIPVLAEQGVLAFLRKDQSGTLFVAVNNSGTAREIPAECMHGGVILGKTQATFSSTSVTVPSNSYIFILKD